MMSLKNIWVGSPYGEYQSLIIESENKGSKDIDYKEFWTSFQQLERIAKNITLYLKAFKPSNTSEGVAEMSNAELVQQVDHRNGYNLAREKAEWANYKERYKDEPDTQERRLQLDPELVTITQKRYVDGTDYWQAELKLYTQAGHIKSFATGDTEEEAKAALNVKVENFISAICIPSKVEPEPPPTTSAPVSPTPPSPPAPVSAQQET